MTSTIPQRLLGQAGVPVGAVGLGCMGMSWAYDPADRDDETSIAAIHAALDAGVTLIDTAAAYGPYGNEELVGRALAGRRHQAVLATKAGLMIDRVTRKFNPDGRPEELIASCEASLQRLGTDAVDLFQLHRVDPTVPLEESWGALAGLVERGLARAIGLSEANVEQCRIAHAIWPVASVQSELSLWTRDRLADVVPWCAEAGATFIPFAPLGRGFLTGTIAAGHSFDTRDFRAVNPRFTAEAVTANQVIADGIGQVAGEVGATGAQVALAWVLAQGDHVVPIPGTRRPARVRENAAAATLALPSEALASLDALPAPVGSRY